MALQPPQGVRAARMDQPPDRGQVGADVALEDGFVVGDAVAQVAYAVEVGMDVCADHAEGTLWRVRQRDLQATRLDGTLEAPREKLLPEREAKAGDDLWRVHPTIRPPMEILQGRQCAICWHPLQ